MPTTSTATSIFPIIFVAACVVVGLGFVITIALMIRNAHRIRHAGHDPFTLQADLATRALESDLLSPSKTTEQRLQELDDLHRRRVISPEEYVRAREQALSGR
ncbi:hypothetical protein B7R54_05285 [Subtercola boreus]|uniref:SHOCT domain-containing protein n=1 Tax=Subtercola boreus TaxID=120213 RepID=A0A3E0VFJ3_9MICO|nr:SHOCT domain-containing protein [Subtercola boreus]RFA08704.1 hypothetical protein B7R54_05285 [Subtercola boreus]TQL54344.1 hypothetical protein FB464_1879 [Subtercola boreus]